MVRQDGGAPIPCAQVRGLFNAPGPAPQAAPAAPPAQAYYQQPQAPVYAAAPAPARSAPVGPPTTSVSSRRKPSSNTHIYVTASSIVVGAAAAIFIYNNIHKIVHGTRPVEEDAVVVTPAPSPVPPASNVAPTTGVATGIAPKPNPFAAPAGGVPSGGLISGGGNNSVATGGGNNGPAGSPNVALGTTPAPLVDATRSIVEFRSSPQSQTTAGCGFAVNDRGFIVTALSAHRQASTLTAYFHDGKSADVVGFVAVAPERDLVMLKLSPVTTRPLPQSASNAVAGTPVYTGGAIRGSSFAMTNIDSTRQLNTNIQSFNRTPYLSEGTYVGYLRNVAQSALRGGPVLNGQGEFVGVLSVAPNGDQYVIDRRHVTELLASAGETARPLAELPGRQATSIATNPISRPAPRVQLAINGGPGAAPLNNPSVGSADASGWLRELESIYARRDSLIATRQQAQDAIKPLLPEAAKLDLDFRAREPAYTRAKFEWDDNERRIQQLTISSANDPPNSLQRNNLAVRISDRSYLRSNLSYEEGRISSIKTEFDAVKKRIDDYNAQLVTVAKEADTLRKDFLTHLDPFGPPSKERGAEGVRFFSEKIPVERDNSFAYLGRASAYLLQGENKLAIADLDAAVKSATSDKAIFLTVRGVAHARAGDLVQGRKDLSDAVRQDDKNAWCRIQYCMVLCRTEAYTIIEQQLRDCMKFAPTNPDAFTMMALMKSTGDDKFRNADYALRTAQAGYDISPTKSWDGSMALAAAHAEKGDFDKAVEFAQKAVAAAGERQTAWCAECLKTFQDKKPLRIDWKTFDYAALK
jgi:tetratricopeptide (TPR) repeat protein